MILFNLFKSQCKKYFSCIIEICKTVKCTRKLHVVSSSQHFFLLRCILQLYYSYMETWFKYHEVPHVQYCCSKPGCPFFILPHNRWILGVALVRLFLWSVTWKPAIPAGTECPADSQLFSSK